MSVRALALPLPRAAPADLIALAKPRIVLMVLVTAAAGYASAAGARFAAHPALATFALVQLLIGTALVAAGTNAMNQIVERDADALMRRTARRPLPDGRVTVGEATAFAAGCGVVGVAWLAIAVNSLTAALAALTLLSYVLVYTPLKRRTPLSTVVGAVPGALPIVGGWTAAGGTLGPEAAVLFAILFLWQMPHFLALSWMYRADYARAGFRVLSVDDPDGAMTFRQMALHAVAVLPVALAPSLLGMTGKIYFAGALAASLLFAWAGIHAARTRSAAGARLLFIVSLVHLPTLLALLVLDGVT